MVVISHTIDGTRFLIRAVTFQLHQQSAKSDFQNLLDDNRYEVAFALQWGRDFRSYLPIVKSQLGLKVFMNSTSKIQILLKIIYFK